MTLDPYAGMDADTIARCKASDANLAGIIRGRRAAAARLLATDPGPATAVRAAWEPIRQALHGLSVPPPPTLPTLNPPPVFDTDWAVGFGPPGDDIDPEFDMYLDEDTGDVYGRTDVGQV